jgi:lipopolysaccharide exporter
MSLRSKFAGEYWLRSGLLIILKNISSLVFSFGGFFLLVRLLDKNAFGVWSLFLGTTTLLEFSRNGLVGNATLKYLAGATKDEYSRILTASFLLTGILTALGIIVNCCIAHWLAELWKMPQIEGMFYLYNVVFILTGFINLFSSIQQANLKFRGVVQSSFAGSVIGFGYILAAYLFRLPISLMSLMWVQLVGGLVGAGISYWNTRSDLHLSRQLDLAWLKVILNYGKYSFGTIIGAMIFSSIDQWMLGYLLAPAAAGIYSIAIRITNVVEVPTGTIAAIVFPQSARRTALEGLGAAKYLYEKSVGVILALLLPGLALLYIFPALAVRFIAGSKYAESIPILRVTIFFCLFIPFARQFGTILDSIGRPKINFYIVLLSAGVNIGLNAVFIRQCGIIGAAYGTLCASVFCFVVSQTVLRKQLGVNVLSTFRYALSFYPELFRMYIRPVKIIAAGE